MSKKQLKSQRLLRACLLQSAVVGLATLSARAGTADTFIYQNAGGGDWNSTADSYSAWYDQSSGTSVKFPVDGGSSQVEILSGSPGVSDVNVLMNQTYVTGLANLEVASGNSITQSGSGTALISQSESLGVGSGTGTYTQSAGTNTVSDNLYVGEEDAAGTYNLSGTGSLSAEFLILGYEDGTGSFNQSGGSVTSTGSLVVGMGEEGQSLSYYTQTGGTVSVTGALQVGGESSGIYALSGTSVLTVTGNESVGLNDAGIFTQTGATHTVSGTLAIGAEGPGTYNLNSGTLTTGYESVGSYGSGSMNQNGGSQTVTNDVNVTSGSEQSSSILSLNAGITQVNGSVYVGGYSSSSGGAGFMLADGGTITVAGTLKIYANASSVSLSSGSLTVGILNTSGSPSGFSWSAGTLHLTDEPLDFIGSFTDPYGDNPLGNQALVLNSGKNLAVDSWEWLADSGSSITQNAGTTNNDVSMYMGGTGAAATYTLNGGTFTTTLTAFIGYGNVYNGVSIGGAAVITQSGGTLNANILDVGYNEPATYSISGSSSTMSVGTLDVGTLSGSSGNVSITGGTLLIGAEVIGDAGSGTVAQAGGSQTVTGNLIIGSQTHSSGFLHVNAGAMQVNGSAYIGGNNTAAAGAGTLGIAGGTLSVSGSLKFYLGSGGLVMSSGSLVAGSTSNAATLSETGGTSTLGAVTGTGTMSVGGGSASATMSVAGLQQNAVTVLSKGKLVLTGGSGNEVNSLAISGTGVVDLENYHILINYGSGTDPVATIRSYLLNGADGGKWDGTTGLTSSAAQANSGSYGLGYADSADPGNPAGISSGTIEIAYTLLGDANLDGKVNGTDFSALAANFNQGGRTWDEGDFNYDGNVNGSDFLLLSKNFNQFASQSALDAADLAALNSFAAANGISLTSVPEPACAGMVVMGAAGALGTRRRSRR